MPAHPRIKMNCTCNFKQQLAAKTFDRIHSLTLANLESINELRLLYSYPTFCQSSTTPFCRNPFPNRFRLRTQTTMSSSSMQTATFKGISPLVKVYGTGEKSDKTIEVPAREAEYWLVQGKRVTDRYDRDLTIRVEENGRRAVVQGEDAYASFLDNQRKRTLERAEGRDPSGRPMNLPARELTDYEAGTSPY